MKQTYNKIISFLKKYQEETNCKGYVIGISGGKDSTIVAKLLCDAIGKENVLGVLMPNGEQHDISYSWEVVETLDIDNIVVNIEDSYISILNSIQPLITGKFDGHVDFGQTDKGNIITLSDKAKTNIAPRLRMTTLYAIAQTLGYRVAGTGNASEIYVGWFTKWGDGACDINPIAHLTCSEVIALGDYLELPEHLVHKTPADGLTGKSDEENLGVSYKVIDAMVKNEYYAIFKHELDDCLKISNLHKAAYHKFAPITIKNYGD